MGRPQVSFAKRQREQAKRERQQMKAARRAERKNEKPEEGSEFAMETGGEAEAVETADLEVAETGAAKQP